MENLHSERGGGALRRHKVEVEEMHGEDTWWLEGRRMWNWRSRIDVIEDMH